MFAQRNTMLIFSNVWKTPHTVYFNIHDEDPGLQIERFEIINICDVFNHKFITELITKN
jgi:hypothetical protein